MLHRGTLLAGQSGSGSEDRTVPQESERAQGALQFKDGLRRELVPRGQPLRSVEFGSRNESITAARMQEASVYCPGCGKRENQMR